MKKYLFPEVDIYELRLSNQILDTESMPYDDTDSEIDGDEGDDPFANA